MALDIHIATKNKELIHIEISETLHSKIFSNLVRWNSYKRLRKIKDYYRADCSLTEADAIFFGYPDLAVFEGSQPSRFQ